MPIASKKISPSGLQPVPALRILVLLLVLLEMLPPRRHVCLSLRTRFLKPTLSPCSSNKPMGQAPRLLRIFASTVANRATGLEIVPRKSNRLSVVGTVFEAKLAPYASLLVPDPLATLGIVLPRVLDRNLGRLWLPRPASPRLRSLKIALGAGVPNVDAGRPPTVPPNIPGLPAGPLLRLVRRLLKQTFFIPCRPLGMFRSFSFRLFGIFCVTVWTSST